MRPPSESRRLCYAPDPMLALAPRHWLCQRLDRPSCDRPLQLHDGLDGWPAHGGAAPRRAHSIAATLAPVRRPARPGCPWRRRDPRPANAPARRCRGRARHCRRTTGRRACWGCRRGWRSPGRCRGRPYTPAAHGTPVPDPRCRCPRSPRADHTSVPRVKGRARAAEWAIVAAITLGAAALRLAHIGLVPPDPFYDAAVRSMELSWHNFFFGAFEPGGSVSIDKPPIDLWLQVASVKLLGFSSTTLKLPEVFGGTVAVPLLFAAVRRMWNTRAGLAAAVAQAVLPIEVITSRSDTMDGVMMALIVLALYLIVRASESGSSTWLLAGAAALGVAFDVKLLESLVALPGLAVL